MTQGITTGSQVANIDNPFEPLGTVDAIENLHGQPHWADVRHPSGQIIRQYVRALTLHRHGRSCECGDQ